MKTNAKIFSFVKCSESSIVASVRIARFISEKIGVPITCDGSISEGPLDVLIIVNGAYAFCDCLKELGTAIFSARQVVWVQNDYTIIMPKVDGEAESPFRRAFRDRHAKGKPAAVYWTTCEKNVKYSALSTYINWNCLTLDNCSDETIRKRRAGSSDALLYYGSYRANRSKDFARFFAEPLVPTIISSPSTKFAKTFQHKLINHCPKIDGDFYHYIGSQGAGLYLEDRLSHSEFHSPANRFYEMLGAGLPMLFQPECGSMMRRGGYDPTLFQVGNPREVKRMMETREEIGEKQRREWLPKAVLERQLLPEKLSGAWKMVRA